MEVYDTLASKLGNKYNLCGIIYHFGSHANYGHYKAMVITKDNKWYECDDSAIGLKNDYHIKGGSVYVLVYKKMGKILQLPSL